MLKENELIGLVAVARQEVRPFTDKQIELVKNFAAQAVIAIENTRLLNELREALEQQTATSAVLGIISSSPGELDPVFKAILENAARICQAQFGTLNIYDGTTFRSVALHNPPPEFAMRLGEVIRPHPESGLGYVARTKQIAHIDDIRTRQPYLEGDKAVVGLADLAGARTLLIVPMLKEGMLIGTIAIYRQEVRPFTDKQIALLQNFAAQAVIAIDNTRLLNELRESLEQQTATSEVLQVISSSPGDLKPVFATMLENAVRICDAKFGNIYRWDGDALHLMASHNTPAALAEARRRSANRPGPETPTGRMIATKTFVHVADLATERAYAARDPWIVSGVELAGVRTLLVMPMLKEDELVGAFTIYRQEVRPFTDKQIDLVQNFAAQAVIAIENTRLLKELRQSLQQQTATADVLKIISRSTFDLKTVLNTLVESAARLCEADMASIPRQTGAIFDHVATYGYDPAFQEFLQRNPISAGRGTVTGRAVLEGKTVHIPDVLNDPEYSFMEGQSVGGYRTALGVPLVREGVAIGVLVLARAAPRPFTAQQIELVETFADQAAIAIENVRLFDDVQKRTAELTEALEQRTATSEVLQVISSSPGELEPVFQAMLENAVRICGAKFGNLWLREGDAFRIGATHGAPQAYVDYLRTEQLFRPEPSRGLGQLLKTKEVFQLADIAGIPTHGDKMRQATIDLAGARTLIGVPMLKDNEVIGAIGIYRQEVRPFTDKQIELVSNFAKQAVIAIENVRLLNELRESLQQQTATADVLKVISRSTFDLQTVLQTLVESAARLCEADKGTITRQKGEIFYRAEAYGFSSEFMEYARSIPVVPDRGSAHGRVLLEGRVVHIPDVLADPEYTFVEAQRLGDFRTVLGVPMLREGIPIGALALTRSEVRPFTDKQIELVSTFADQAAIAIENVRLFESVEARTRELANSLDDLRTAQDRLIQTEKLASLGQLTAGIAHEIKNPLNFVNNFSAVSVELIDELREALGGIHLDSKQRAEISEIADMLQSNLDKVVQHGKRADAIVKNMLLHSRQGSGEHRPVDINALVDESLNLAYHGARAEKQGFNITLERSFDPAAGEVDLFPQEITRVLLNLISNGFYAATKRKAEANGGDYEPTLAASDQEPRRQRRNQDSRQRHWHPARGKGKDVQSVLYDQARRRRYRARPFHQSRHHRQATWRFYRGRYAAR